MTEYRIHVMRAALGLENDMSAEAEAGGILEAETATEIHEICKVARAYAEANRAR